MILQVPNRPLSLLVVEESTIGAVLRRGWVVSHAFTFGNHLANLSRHGGRWGQRGTQRDGRIASRAQHGEV